MASTGVTIRIKSNRLPQISAAVRPLVVAEVQKSAFRIEAGAKAIVPVDTGTLRRSIHSVFSNGGLTGIIGPSAFYGKFIEFGVRGRAARPFMRPPALAEATKFAAAVKAALRALK